MGNTTAIGSTPNLADETRTANPANVIDSEAHGPIVKADGKYDWYHGSDLEHASGSHFGPLTFSRIQGEGIAYGRQTGPSLPVEEGFSILTGNDEKKLADTIVSSLDMRKITGDSYIDVVVTYTHTTADPVSTARYFRINPERLDDEQIADLQELLYQVSQGDSPTYYLNLGLSAPDSYSDGDPVRIHFIDSGRILARTIE